MSGKRHTQGGLISAEQIAEWKAALAELDREIADDMQAVEHKQKKRANLSALIENAAPFIGANTGARGSSTERETSGGSLASLMDQYLNDPRSPYRNLRYMTKTSYDSLIRRIRAEYGSYKLADLKKEDIQRIYDGWTEGGKLGMAHSRATMLRGLINFGADQLKDSECERLSLVLHKLRFKADKTPREQLSEDQVRLIIDKAHELRWPSIALALAFQFSCEQFAQKDVIGEWVPRNEPGDSNVFYGELKWLRGIRWDEINDYVLRHRMSRDDKVLELPLRTAPLVMIELDLIKERRRGSLPTVGPVIEREKIGRPWTTAEFRYRLLKIADECDIQIPGRSRHAGIEGSENSASDEDEAGEMPTADIRSDGLDLVRKTHH